MAIPELVAKIGVPRPVLATTVEAQRQAIAQYVPEDNPTRHSQRDRHDEQLFALTCSPRRRLSRQSHGRGTWRRAASHRRKPVEEHVGGSQPVSRTLKL